MTVATMRAGTVATAITTTCAPAEDTTITKVSFLVFFVTLVADSVVFLAADAAVFPVAG